MIEAPDEIFGGLSRRGQGTLRLRHQPAPFRRARTLSELPVAPLARRGSWWPFEGADALRSASTTTPWLDDACSLVEAFRARELSPLEALDACIEAIGGSPLNAFCHTDFDRARDAARTADVSLPFGGVPFGVKELERVRAVALHRGLDDLQGPGIGV